MEQFSKGINISQQILQTQLLYHIMDILSLVYAFTKFSFLKEIIYVLAKRCNGYGRHNLIKLSSIVHLLQSVDYLFAQN